MLFHSGQGAGGFSIFAPSFEYLGRITPISTTSTPTYSSFSGTFSGLTTENISLIIAVIQSRDANGSTGIPYSNVTIDGQSATIINRSYTGGTTDFNSTAIAYIKKNIGNSINISVTLNATHEGQANIFLYKMTSNFATFYNSNSNVISSGSVIQTNLTTPPTPPFVSKLSAVIAVSTTSNSTSAWTIGASQGTMTQNASLDAGTTEFITVSSSINIPKSTSITFTASGSNSTNDASILVASFYA